MVVAPVVLRCGSNIDSSIPLPHSAANRSTKGKMRLKDFRMVRILSNREVFGFVRM